MNLRTCAVMMLLLLIGSCAPKQKVQQEPPAAAASEEKLVLPDIEIKKEPPVEKKAEKPPVEKKAEEQYVMLNFENTDIETIISTIGEMLKINYILAPGVSGKITIQSHNKIPLSELFSTFQTMLEFNGLTAVKYGSFYRIVPIDTVKQQPVPIDVGKTPLQSKDSGFVTQEIPLEYVKATDVANIVRNLMPRGTDIITYEPTNMLIITAPPSGIIKFLKLIEAIDIPATDRDAVKTFVYNVENGEAKKLVEILKNLYAKKTAAGTTVPPVKSVSPAPAPTPVPAPGTRTPAPRTTAPSGASVQEGLAAEIEGDVVLEAYEDINAILIKATPRAYLALLETIKKLDVQPKQVLIEVLIAEITLNDDTKFGLEWLLRGTVRNNESEINLIGGVRTGNVQFNTEDNKFDFTVPAAGFASVIDPRQFNAIIYAEENRSNINVLASPHVLALDNKEAKIEIADEVPIATSITQPTAGAGTIINATSTVQFKSAGIILTVTPHINDKKQVTLKLVQEASQPTETPYKIGGQDYQGFRTRKATTTAIVQDGHTLVIGGLISEGIGKSRTGVPILSRLPILGYLFGTTTDKVEKKELILLVTPRVVANHEEADELTKELESRVRAVKEKIREREKRLRERDDIFSEKPEEAKQEEAKQPEQEQGGTNVKTP